ncbi:MAG TPA: hypothetical protein VJ953_10500 [Saprospiraceae bacterium]|nr:hypothetical protein [Saprospiraceae bacterium]
MDHSTLLFKSEWYAYIEQNQLVAITYRINERKMVMIETYIKELFQKGRHWLLVTETGLTIPLPQIKSIVLSSRFG